MGPLKNKITPKRLLQYLVILGLLGAGVGGFISFGPPGLYAKSGTPEFCAGCHVMESEYENWFHGGHSKLKCIDCHLPNDNFARHFTWKGIEGMRDAFDFYSGRVPESITLSDHGAAILLENCRRCHEQMVSLIKEDRNCWQCHRRLSHKTTGTF
ncbi:MAG: cytochrome c nitrite reductase small subunit [Deltaproteobacteria bacterium]|nr:cytochrome c nitrite reductase small subunit [Deltaproteobacteria bacterium]